MKKIIAISFSLSVALSLFSQADSVTDDEILRPVESIEYSAIFEQGNNAYGSMLYDTAIAYYRTLIDGGVISHQLYYNLGNAYYKLKNYPQAILHYEKARLLAPHDEDISFNLQLAERHVIDEVERIPPFILKRWYQQLSYQLHVETWTILSLIFFFIALCCMANLMLWKKQQKITSLALLCVFGLFICSMSFALTQQHERINTQAGIVTQQRVIAHSEPTERSKELFILHGGLKVNAEFKPVNGFLEIALLDGRKGWVERSAITKIAFEE